MIVEGIVANPFPARKIQPARPHDFLAHIPFGRSFGQYLGQEELRRHRFGLGHELGGQQHEQHPPDLRRPRRSWQCAIPAYLKPAMEADVDCSIHPDQQAYRRTLAVPDHPNEGRAKNACALLLDLDA